MFGFGKKRIEAEPMAAECKHEWEDVTLLDLPPPLTFKGQKPQGDFLPDGSMTGMFRFYYKCKACGQYARRQMEGFI